MNLFVTIAGLAYNVIIILGVYAWILAKRKISGEKEDFLLSGRKLPWFPCAASMALTALGGGHINGLSFQSWHTGVASMSYCFGSGIAIILMLRFSGIWFRRSGCTTVNEMIGRVFHPILVPILGGIGVAYAWGILCVETQGMATVIAGLTGLSNLSGGVIGAIIGVLYVFLAGMKEIGYVNAINATLMYVFGFTVLAYIGIASVNGGWGPINDTLLANNADLVHALGSPEILKTYVIGTFFANAFGLGMVQGNLQAAASVDNVKVLKKACTWAIPMNVLFGIIILAMGLAAKALPGSGDVPFGSDGVVKMVLLYMPSWLQAAVVGVFLSAMLSTFAMLVLALATNLNRDVLGYFPYFKNMSSEKEARLSRMWIIVFSASAALAAVTIRAGVNMAITWLFCWNIPVFFLFVIALYWKRSGKGALITLTICWTLNVVLTFTPLAASLGLEGNNYSIFMMVTSIVVGLITTGLDKNAKEKFSATYTRQRAAYDAGNAVKAAQ